MPVQPDDYALVVGINHYLSGDLNVLSNALRDADEVAQWLLDQNTGGGLLPEHCRKIMSQEKSGRPANAEIDDALEEIFDLVKQRPGPARRFYFYFSGHGMAASIIQAYLCLPKWSNQRRRMAIDSQDYWLMLADTGLFREIICLFDCCRSYKPNVGGLPSTLGSARPDVQAANSRLFIGFAAEYLQSAFEDPSVDGHSFFTRALLSGLRGGACLESGGSPAERLREFLLTETVRLAQLANQKQTPTVFNGFPVENEPVFGSALPLDIAGANKLVYLVSISSAPGRAVALIRPDATEIPWDGSQPWRIEVGEGLHVLEDKTSGKLLRLPRDATQGDIHVDF